MSGSEDAIPGHDFAVVRCRECAREVVTYPDPSPDDPDVRRCVHCDERASGPLRWLGVADLDALGYVVDSGEDAGSECTSCGTGGCGVKPAGDGS